MTTRIYNRLEFYSVEDRTKDVPSYRCIHDGCVEMAVYRIPDLDYALYFCEGHVPMDRLDEAIYIPVPVTA